MASGSSPHLKLEEDGIYAALFTNDPGKSWHWAIYYHSPNASGRQQYTGWKIHATNRHPPYVWQYEKVPQSVLATQTLVLLAKIGSGIGADGLDPYLATIPMTVPRDDVRRESKFTYRVWFRTAIRTLNYHGVFVACNDVDALENELISRARLAESILFKQGGPTVTTAKNSRGTE